MIMLLRNAVELSRRAEQADRRRKIVLDVLLVAAFHGECGMLSSFHRAGAGAFPAHWVGSFQDLFNCLACCCRELPRGKKPPGWKPGGGRP